MAEGICYGLIIGVLVLFGWWMGLREGVERGERAQFWRERGGEW